MYVPRKTHARRDIRPAFKRRPSVAKVVTVRASMNFSQSLPTKRNNEIEELRHACGRFGCLMYVHQIERGCVMTAKAAATPSRKKASNIFKEAKSFSSFSVNDLQKAKEFYGQTLG